MVLTFRTKGTRKSSRLALCLFVTTKNIHRAGLSQIMERAVLLYVDVRPHEGATAASRYTGRSCVRSSTSQYNFVHSGVLDDSIKAVADT